jgi:drug/metabolite transporter (DMT)-like permease
MPKIANICYLTTAMVLAAAAQLLVKYAINLMVAKGAVKSGNIIVNIFNFALDWHFIGGILLYLVATLFWMHSLTRVDLSYATPFLALTYIIMMAGAYYFFNEPLTPQKMAGSALVIIGLVVINLGN